MPLTKTARPAARRPPNKNSAAQFVYFFGAGKADGTRRMRMLLGGKGAGLAEMTNLGIPVPPGFTLTTAVCNHYYANHFNYPAGLEKNVEAALARVEALLGRTFGDPENPLLVSVRSGAPASMPGMMDTILNLGLNDAVVEGLAAASGNPKFAWDAYRRFVQMYANVVLGLKAKEFEPMIAEVKKLENCKEESQISPAGWRGLIPRMKAKVREQSGTEFPETPQAQLWGAIGAVFQSWMNERAVIYRKLNRLPADWGTAVNIQAMVFGNLGNDCATGVVFTRHPSTGEKFIFGEYLPNAQGEDVVAGLRTPRPVSKPAGGKSKAGDESLEETLPATYKALLQTAARLEKHFKDMQDIEFTVERGRLWLLQTRAGKRTARAAVKIAADLVKEKLITPPQAVLRVDPAQLDQLLHPQIDPAAEKSLLLKGLPASPGAAAGRVVFHAADAEARAKKGEPVILVRRQTSPEDIGGFHAAAAILTATGGMTSHAAVVARGMGKVCVVGAHLLEINEAEDQALAGATPLRAGDWLTINGTTGEVYAGRVATVPAQIADDLQQILTWADRERRMRVRANADTGADAAKAREFGAEGIGLCRTEHMFFEGDRISYFREMILAADEAGRRRALGKLLPIQREDFKALFKAMAGLPVTIRLLDPPLHEFLPQTDAEFEAVAIQSGVRISSLHARAAALHEANPMLGHRGCRLAVTYPEIYEMQVRAIIEAACELKAAGLKVAPEIMHPLVAFASELAFLRELTDTVAAQVMAEKKQKISYTVGTMIELPRAALMAAQIAAHADFFSFGTNDLTQTTLGMSRDDANNFFGDYETRQLIPHDPFAILDTAGVGELVRLGTERGRQGKPALKVGVCGEHGGEPQSIEFFDSLGLDYVSCSPFRIPVARLAAAHAALKAKGAIGSSTK